MSNLHFQDFNLGDSNSPFTSVNSNQEFRAQTTDTSNLVQNSGTETETSNSNKSHFLSFQFYQQFFDVDTEQVYSRILNSVVPRKNGNFIRDHVQPLPDLYGPFWICVTLVFSAAISANFAHYIESLGQDLYTNDFTLVTGISTLISCYVCIMPFAIYTLLWYRNSPIQYTYVELLCTFGYSLSSLVVVSALWAVLHFSWLRWTLIISSVVFSGFVLCQTIWEAIRSDSNRILAFAVVGGVMFAHFGCALFIKECYFDTVLPAKSLSELPPQIPPTSAVLLAGTPVLPKAAAMINGTADKIATSNSSNSVNSKKESVKTEESKKDEPKKENSISKKDNPKNKTKLLTSDVNSNMVVKPKNETEN